MPQTGSRANGSDQVLHGQNGWLFLAGDSNKVLDQHTGTIRLDDRFEAAWDEILSTRKSFLDKRGVAWGMFIVPDKEAVYRDFLPPSVSPLDERPVCKILDASARADAPVRYLLDDLLLGRKRYKQPVFFKTDTHWNQLGAFIGYQAICNHLEQTGIQVPRIEAEDINWIDSPYCGDLGKKLDPCAVETATGAVLPHNAAKIASDNRVRGHGGRIVFEAPDSSAPSCVLFGDSFSDFLLMYLKESFRRLVFVFTSMLDHELVDEETPDVVLNVSIERFLVKVPNDADASAKLSAMVQEKLARGTLRTDIPGIS